MKNQKIVFGNLEGLKKAETSEISEKLAQLRTFPPCKSVDLSNFINPENFKTNENLENSSTSELIKRIKFGCNDSFNLVDLQIRGILKSISVSQANSDKKNNSLTFDSVQDTILKVYENILIGGFDDVETKEHLKSKSIKILKNILFSIGRPANKNNYYTKTRLFKVSENGECELNRIDKLGNRCSFLSTEFSEAEKLRDSEKLEKSLNKLSDIQKTVIDLFYFQNVGHKEICFELDITLDSSMSNLKRARKKLKDYYLEA